MYVENLTRAAPHIQLDQRRLIRIQWSSVSHEEARSNMNSRGQNLLPRSRTCIVYIVYFGIY